MLVFDWQVMIESRIFNTDLWIDPNNNVKYSVLEGGLALQLRGVTDAAICTIDDNG